MDHDLKRLRAIFDEVIEAPPEARAALLAKRCGDDIALRRRVEAIIATAEADQPFLSEPTRTNPPFEKLIELTPVTLSEGPGTRIGPYKLLQKIGEGGFGVVFMAEQDQPVRRRVALKIIKLGMDTRQVVARFEQERQALALMDHPNIARVFDAGATDSGRPYFVMEYVKGDPITSFADAHKLSVRQRLDLLAQVCTAVQHAHTKGVIHRDIKPRNVLVSMVDGKPFAKVIDFGIAKATGARLTDKTLFTEHRQLIGTPEYMSPEQAEGSPDIDTRTDVYALGVLLYELLTGATPFDAARLRSAAYAEMQRIIKEEEPPMPSVRLSRSLDSLAATAAARQAEPGKLGTLIKGELDWIVMKSLDKDRVRRYETPNQLAADVQRHLSGEPVLAAPPSTAYRLRKFMRKHKEQVTAAAIVVVMLLGGIAMTSYQAVRARRAEVKTAHALEETEVALEQSEWNGYAANLSAAQSAMAAADWPGARERLTRCPESLRGLEWSLLNEEALTIVGEFRNANSLVFSPEGTRVLTASWDNTARLWDLEGRQIGEAIKHEGLRFVRSAVFSPDGTRVLTASWDNTARLWDLGGRQIVETMKHEGIVNSAVFSPDGTRVLTASYEGARLWDPEGRQIGEPMRHERGVKSAVFSPDGTRVLTASYDDTARLWDIEGRQIGEAMKHVDDVNSAVFSPEGTRVLTASYDDTARLWDIEGRQIGEAMKHEDAVNSAVFSPEGTRVLTASDDNTARLWDLEGLIFGASRRVVKRASRTNDRRRCSWNGCWRIAIRPSPARSSMLR